MILGFKKEINCMQTLFAEKILNCLQCYKLITKRQFYDFSYLLNRENMNNCLFVIPKIHTIREDKNNRWKAGMIIHAYYNVRQKNMLQFAPDFKCNGIQEIEIKYYLPGQIPFVYVDGKMLSFNQVNKLVVNDGFFNARYFFEFFTKDFKGKIIHFTDFRY
jgi:hypothetical protein